MTLNRQAVPDADEQAVSVYTVMEVVGWPPPNQAAVHMRYTADEPFEVTFDLLDPSTGRSALWRFDRDLLAGGGVGDVAVHIMASRDKVTDWYLHLTGDGPTGAVERLVLRGDPTVIDGFRRRVYNLVPAGAEHLDVDAALTALLNNEPPSPWWWFS